MSNKLLFISVFNLGGIQLALNHLESLRRQHITNYCAYVTDQESYTIVKEKGHTVELVVETTIDLAKDKADFGTQEFNTLSYTRYKVIGELLEQNRPVWYLDIDSVVLQNLNDVYNKLKNTHYHAVMQDDINMLCTGCMLLFPTPITLKLVRSIYANRTSEDNDQITLAKILMQNPNIIKIMPLNKVQFPNGLLYFNEPNENPVYRRFQDQFNKSTLPVYFVHANWMIGMETKIEALKRKGLWYV
jgi:lipopolysaccharide biosynthesis glycosyltransferase